MAPQKRHRICVICGTRERHKAGANFFARFPLDENRCKEWLKVVGNQDLVHLPIEKLHDLKYVCEKHFIKKDFTKTGTRLKKRAIPKLHLTAIPLTDDCFLEFPLHIGSDPIPSKLKGPVDTNAAGSSLAQFPANPKHDSQQEILHKFPDPDKDLDRFRIWLYNIGGDILSLQNSMIFKRRRVCHLHFETKFHTRSKLLSPNAIPTLYLSDERNAGSEVEKTDVPKQGTPTTANAIETAPQNIIKAYKPPIQVLAIETLPNKPSKKNMIQKDVKYLEGPGRVTHTVLMMPDQYETRNDASPRTSSIIQRSYHPGTINLIAKRADINAANVQRKYPNVCLNECFQNVEDLENRQIAGELAAPVLEHGANIEEIDDGLVYEPNECDGTSYDTELLPSPEDESLPAQEATADAPKAEMDLPFSWQRDVAVVPCDDIEYDSEVVLDEQMFSSIEEPSEAKDRSLDEEASKHPEDTHENFKCNICCSDIIGFRYSCVQCADYDLCGACEARRAHRAHYVLRIPPGRPLGEVLCKLQTIRRALLSDAIVHVRGGPEEPVEIKEEEDDPMDVEPLEPTLPSQSECDNDSITQYALDTTLQSGLDGTNSGAASVDHSYKPKYEFSDDDKPNEPPKQAYHPVMSANHHQSTNMAVTPSSEVKFLLSTCPADKTQQVSLVVGKLNPKPVYSMKNKVRKRVINMCDLPEAVKKNFKIQRLQNFPAQQTSFKKSETQRIAVQSDKYSENLSSMEEGISLGTRKISVSDFENKQCFVRLGPDLLTQQPSPLREYASINTQQSPTKNSESDFEIEGSFIKLRTNSVTQESAMKKARQLEILRTSADRADHAKLQLGFAKEARVRIQRLGSAEINTALHNS